MSTRGAIGFYCKGKGKITYNHWDSYPSDLGINILEEIRDIPIEKLKEVFEQIKLIKDEQAKPTAEEFKQYSEYSDPSVGGSTSNTKVKTYYQLLRKLQGTLKPYIEGKVKIMIDSESFLKDSLFCEWAYIINLDEEVLEVWKGFRKENSDNRYKWTIEEIKKELDEWKKRDINYKKEYYNCALIKKFPLNNLPTKEEFLKEVGD